MTSWDLPRVCVSDSPTQRNYYAERQRTLKMGIGTFIAVTLTLGMVTGITGTVQAGTGTSVGQQTLGATVILLFTGITAFIVQMYQIFSKGRENGREIAEIKANFNGTLLVRDEKIAFLESRLEKAEKNLDKANDIIDKFHIQSAQLAVDCSDNRAWINEASKNRAMPEAPPPMTLTPDPDQPHIGDRHGH
jgi:hypothetical protein